MGFAGTMHGSRRSSEINTIFPYFFAKTIQIPTFAEAKKIRICVADHKTDIWEAFRKGDKAAFEQLLWNYYRPMFDYGLRFQPDPDLLRDDLHDLLVSLWERKAHLNDTANLKLYLFKALRHQIFRNKSGNSQSADWESLDPDIISAGEAALPNFAEEEAAKRQSGQIHHTLLKLSPRQQEVLHLKFFEELPNEQIAHILGISRAATANLLYAALKAFKALWKPEYHLLFFYLFA